MTSPQDKHWLDKAIENTAPGTQPEPDFKTWQEQHPKALASLQKRAQKRTRSRTDLSAAIELGRRIMRSPVTKLAIAAVFIAGCLFLVRHLQGGDTVTEPQPTIVKKIESEKALRNEFTLAQALYEQKDLPGLLILLETGQEATQVKIAGFLAEIGDASAIPTLQRLADVWDGEGENPFQAAVNTIENRQKSDQSEQINSNKEIDLNFNMTSPWRFESGGSLLGANFMEEYFGLDTWLGLPSVALASDFTAVRNSQMITDYWIQVEVVDELGYPIEGVRVYASALEAELNGLPGFAVCDDITDANGWAMMDTLKPSRSGYEIMAHHSAYALEHVTLKSADPHGIEQVRLVLKKGGGVHGYAEYSDGVPAEGVNVFLVPDWWRDGAMQIYNECLVDAQGLFTLEGVVNGNYRVDVGIKSENSDSSRCYPIRQVQFPLPEGELLLVQIPRKSPGSLASITGTVVWTTEKRVNRDILIKAYRSETDFQQASALEGQAESFEINSLEPGTYTLKFSGVNLKETVLENVEAPCSGVEVVLAYQELRLRGNVVVAETQAPVDQFKVRFANARPLEGIGFIRGTNRWTQCVNGHFDVWAPGSGAYQVQVMAPGYAVAYSPFMRTDEAESVTIELVQGGRVTGRVTNTAGEPVSGAIVMPLSYVGGEAYCYGESYLYEQDMPKTINGFFELEQLPPGSETIKVTHPAYLPELVENIEVFGGQTTEPVEIVLKRGVSVEGFVFDGQGQPEANVTLLYQKDSMSADGPPITVVTDAKGYYRVNHLPPGEMCTIRRANLETALGMVCRAYRVPKSQTGRLDFGGKTWVSGILEKDGSPLSNARMRLSLPEYSQSSELTVNGITDEAGRFVLFGVPDGRYGIYIRNSEKLNNYSRATIVEIWQDHVDLGVISVESK
ncbi:MAG: carboxypeptidase-like regulatory domain-containing protein [Phycisphaerae bacterium]|nr:carboxypeptidase-like regulatory domain-containing protein [Phycisphaerae bacterium]